MASSILNSDDGVISGTSGLKSTGGDDGVLVFQSKGTETARINTDKQIVAAAGTASLPIYSTTGDLNTGIYFPAADNIGFATNGVIRGRWTTDGLCFGSDTAAANALDDYEEGTWTPSFTGAYYGFTPGGSATGWGNYVKIGDYVYINCRINFDTSETLVVGDRGFITGLPFVATGSVNMIGSGTFVQPGSWASNTNAHGFTNINTSANEMGFMTTIVNGTPPALNSTFVGFFAVYKITNTLS